MPSRCSCSCQVWCLIPRKHSSMLCGSWSCERPGNGGKRKICRVIFARSFFSGTGAGGGGRPSTAGLRKIDAIACVFRRPYIGYRISRILASHSLAMGLNAIWVRAIVESPVPKYRQILSSTLTGSLACSWRSGAFDALRGLENRLLKPWLLVEETDAVSAFEGVAPWCILSCTILMI